MPIRGRGTESRQRDQVYTKSLPWPTDTYLDSTPLPLLPLPWPVIETGAFRYWEIERFHQHTKTSKHGSKALFSDHFITANRNVSKPRRTPLSFMPDEGVLRGFETLRSVVMM